MRRSVKRISGAAAALAVAAALALCGPAAYAAPAAPGDAQTEAAQAFLDYLRTEEAMAVFQSVGFSPAN